VLPIQVPGGFRVIAHRGASGYAPENTRAAFELTEWMGVKEVETDLQLTRDNQLVLCHDESLDRFGHNGVNIADLPYKQLQALDMGSWFSPFLYAGERMITLKELFSQFGKRFFYHLEIKTKREEVIRLIMENLDEFDLHHRVLITCFDDAVLDTIGTLMPDVPRGWLVGSGCFTQENTIRAAAAGFNQICPRAEDIREEVVSIAHKHHMEVRAYDVISAQHVKQVIEAGGDGLTFDRPDWLRHAEFRTGEAL
jgi:glycerophosphoryl diester phosphodiesterase